MDKLDNPVPGLDEKGSIDETNKENDKSKVNSPAKKKVKVTSDKTKVPYRGRRAPQEYRDCAKGLYSPPPSPSASEKTSSKEIKEGTAVNKVGLFQHEWSPRYSYPCPLLGPTSISFFYWSTFESM